MSATNYNDNNNNTELDTKATTSEASLDGQSKIKSENEIGDYNVSALKSDDDKSSNSKTESSEGSNGTNGGKKKRTVTFAEIDASSLDADGTIPRLYTIIPPAKYDDCEAQDDAAENAKRQERVILVIKIGIIIFFLFICVLVFVLMLGNTQKK